MSEVTVKAADLLGDQSQPVIVATPRRFASALAFVFPISACAYIVHVFLQVGLAKVLSHTMARALLLPGIVALAIWVMRYWRPALITFTLKGNPIEIADGGVKFFGSVIPLSRDPVFHTDASNVYVTADGGLELKERKFFVKSKKLDINMSPLTP